MLGYLMNLSKFHSSVGILFFSKATWKHDQKSPACVENYHRIQDRKFTLSEMHVDPSNPEHLKENLEIVYKHILASCHKINDTAN